MLSMVQILLIVLVVVLFIFFNTTKGNKIFEKRILLSSLLFAVSLFIKTEDDVKNKDNFRNKISMKLAKFILHIDMWFLNFRSKERRKEEIYIKQEKKERD